MEILFFWIVSAIIVGIVANSRGRSGIGWFFLSSLLLSPLLGLILVLCLTNLRKQKLETTRHEELLRVLGAGALPLPPTNDKRTIDERVAQIKRELAAYQRGGQTPEPPMQQRLDPQDSSPEPTSRWQVG